MAETPDNEFSKGRSFSPDPYFAAWPELGRRRWQLLAALGSFVPGWVAFARLPGDLPWYALAAWGAFVAITSARIRSFPCPRCSAPFGRRRTRVAPWGCNCQSRSPLAPDRTRPASLRTSCDRVTLLPRPRANETCRLRERHWTGSRSSHASERTRLAGEGVSSDWVTTLARSVHGRDPAERGCHARSSRLSLGPCTDETRSRADAMREAHGSRSVRARTKPGRARMP
jgi:hypothetical protein